MFLYALIAFLIISLIVWVGKLTLKKQLSKNLGRKVSDRELTSISTWMEATPPSQSQNRER